MKARLIETKEVRVTCPHCGEPAGSVTHLLEEKGRPRHFGSWYCNECGRGYSGEVQADGSIELRLDDKMLIRTLDHLALPPQAQPVHFLVEGMDFVDAKGNRAARRRSGSSTRSTPARRTISAIRIIVWNRSETKS